MKSINRNKTICNCLAAVLSVRPETFQKDGGKHFVLDMPYRKLSRYELEHALSYGVEDVLDIRYSKYCEKIWSSITAALKKRLPKSIHISPEELHDEFVFEAVRVKEPDPSRYEQQVYDFEDNLYRES